MLHLQILSIPNYDLFVKVGEDVDAELAVVFLECRVIFYVAHEIFEAPVLLSVFKTY